MILALLYTLSLFWGVGYFFMLNIADNYHCAKVSSPINYLQEVALWEPLEKVLQNTVGIEKCKYFMYMGRVALGEVWVYLYKHTRTRRYLNLDGRGYAYKFYDGAYRPEKIQDALEHVF